MTLLPIGFVCLVSGVVLPRIEGKFTAGPSGLTAEILPVHELDQPRYVISGPALAPSTADSGDASEDGAGGVGEPDGQRITIGDVWDALETCGQRPDGVGLGHAYFRLRDDRHLDMPNRGFMDWGTASNDLLAVLRTWGVRPVASGKYPVRPDVAPHMARLPAGSLRNIPTRDPG